MGEPEIKSLSIDHENADRKHASPPTAWAPYPAELTETLAWNGETIELRPIRPEDEPEHRAFVDQLKPEDLRLRFFNVRREMTRSELARLVHIDYDREMAFIATQRLPNAKSQTLGVVRAVIDAENIEAEFGIIVRSDLKAHGLGYALLVKMIDYLRARGIQRLVADVLRENHSMCEMVRTLGFEPDKHTIESDALRFALILNVRGTPAVGPTASCPTVRPGLQAQPCAGRSAFDISGKDFT